MRRRRLDRDLKRRTHAIALGALAVAAAALTIYTAHHALPHGSTDLDEVAYQAQANALRAGHVTLSRASVDPSFRPFLSGVHGSRVVFKYQPVWPALIASSDALFGSSAPLHALMAVGAVLTVAWLAWELFQDGRVALLASAFVVGSPFVWVQNATLLGYNLSFVLGTAAGAALLRATRTRSRGAALAAGALLGLGVLHRPFDTAVAVIPIVAFVTARALGAGTLRRLGAFVALGGAPFALLFFAYNRALTGSFTKLTYSTTGQFDKFGFGTRASFVGTSGRPFEPIHYTVSRAFASTGSVLALLPRFVGFAPVAAVGVAVACWLGRRDGRVRLLIAMTLTTVVAYFFWWGQANAQHFRLDIALGPLYGYALVAPLAIGAAWGLLQITATRARVALAVLAVAWLAIAPLAVMHRTVANGRARTAALARVAAPAPALVFESPSFPGDPYVPYANPTHLAGARVVALDLGAQDLDVLDRFPNVNAYATRSAHVFGNPFDTLRVTRVPVHRVASSVGFDVDLHTSLDPKIPGAAYVRVGDGAPMFVGQTAPGIVDASWHVPMSGWPPGTVELAVGITTAAPGDATPNAMTGAWYECRFAGRVDTNGRVDMLTPCVGWHHYEFPDGKTATATEDVSTVLPVRLTPR